MNALLLPGSGLNVEQNLSEKDQDKLNQLILFLRNRGYNEILVDSQANSNALRDYINNSVSANTKLDILEYEIPLITNKISRFDKNDFILLIDSLPDYACDLNLLNKYQSEYNAELILACTVEFSNTGFYLDDSYQIIWKNEKKFAKEESFIPSGFSLCRRDTLLKHISEAKSLQIRQLLRAEKAFGIPVPKFPYHDYHKLSKALFLDRDGIINEDSHYVHKIEDIQFCPGIFDLCSDAQRRGYKIIVATNQAGIARGYFEHGDVESVHAWMATVFAKHGIAIEGFVYCPYHEKGNVAEYTGHSLFRKPEPGMFLDAAEKHNIDLTHSIMVGDKNSDRIKLPYLRSYIIKSQYVPTGYDFESLDSFRRFIFKAPQIPK
ncbi:MAG: HAD-IIIA family hydrolase [Chitinivibrionales bacterium]|nr:HAD-IIIA family hydrolase [Chitinivibrionales bacterium]